MWNVRLCTAATIWVSVAFAAQAETRALVVGIDNYANVNQLHGAVADARDLSDALRMRGVKDLSVMLDADATRAHVLGAIDAIVARAKPEDLVIVTFAGHGARERWGAARPPGINEGDPREVFLLADVTLPDASGVVSAEAASGAGERIAGAEINIRLNVLGAKGVRTIFLADSCYGGGLTREIMPALKSPLDEIYRFVPTYAFKQGEDPLDSVFSALLAPINTDDTLPDLTFLAAVDETRKSPEIAIPRGSTQMRGALSYAFARLIDGTADVGDGKYITRGTLVDYLSATVRSITDNRQDPDLRPRKDFDRNVIDTTRDLRASPTTVANVPPALAQQPTAAESASAAIRVYGASEALPAVIGDVPIIITQNLDQADVAIVGREAYSKARDLIASDIGDGDLAGILQREVGIRRLQAMSLQRSRAIKLENGDKRYVAGDHIVITAPSTHDMATASEFYALFSITGTGIVQFLYPDAKQGDGVIVPADQPFPAIRAVPPYGTDTVVLVTSPKPLDPLIAELKRLDGTRNSSAAIDLVERSLGDGIRIGLQGIYTAATGK